MYVYTLMVAGSDADRLPQPGLYAIQYTLTEEICGGRGLRLLDIQLAQELTHQQRYRQ